MPFILFCASLYLHRDIRKHYVHVCMYVCKCNNLQIFVFLKIHYVLDNANSKIHLSYGNCAFDATPDWHIYVVLFTLLLSKSFLSATAQRHNEMNTYFTIHNLNIWLCFAFCCLRYTLEYLPILMFNLQNIPKTKSQQNFESRQKVCMFNSAPEQGWQVIKQ